MRRTLAFEKELDLATARVPVGVARDLGNGRGDACLVLCVEADERCYLTRTLSRDNHVLFVVEGYGEKSFGYHVADPLFITTTVTSSRPRSWSRYRTPAMRAECLAIRPG